MKQLIVLAASVLLGLFLFDMIAGPSDDSFYSLSRRLWQQEVQMRTVDDTRSIK